MSRAKPTGGGYAFLQVMSPVREPVSFINIKNLAS
jgi:hypothetical protein